MAIHPENAINCDWIIMLCLGTRKSLTQGSPSLILYALQQFTCSLAYKHDLIRYILCLIMSFLGLIMSFLGLIICFLGLMLYDEWIKILFSLSLSQAPAGTVQGNTTPFTSYSSPLSPLLQVCCVCLSFSLPLSFSPHFLVRWPLIEAKEVCKGSNSPRLDMSGGASDIMRTGESRYPVDHILRHT